MIALAPPPPAELPRLWPAWSLVAVQWTVWHAVPAIWPESLLFGTLAGLGCGLVLLGWWLLFSRVPWLDRLGAIALMIFAVFATRRFVHPSIANGMMGMMLPFTSVPLLSLALVWLLTVTRRSSSAWRRTALIAGIALAAASLTLVRTGGLTGEGVSDLHWRWSPTPEERLLRQVAAKPALARPEAAPPAPSRGRTPAGWPGFRGPARDGVVRGARIKTDWSSSAPVELWRRPVGPGWSSFAVEGDFFYTQEQRGEDELVTCYRLATGEPVWRHADAARFWESNGGAGPRGTPTLGHGRVYAGGATGLLNALDARTGSVVWSRNAASDTGRKIPGWGFASSPLLVGDAVIVATAGVLAAYDAATGAVRWIGPKGGFGYSSPHRLEIAGVEQVVLLNGTGALAVAPAGGAVLWQHEWKSDGIVQPALLTGNDLLIGSGSGLGVKSGLQRVAVAKRPAGWTLEERWTSKGLKPYFNDFVVHAGHAYGFDGSSLACIELAKGERRWKGGRYGHGQLLLLADQELLLVLSEKGAVALVAATPGQFTELARRPTLEGKTWNHPVLAGDILLVRNDHEMAAFRLP